VLSYGTPLAKHGDVTVRITSREEGKGRVVRVDGWLVACDVATLEETLGDRVRGTRLELADLRSADAAGVAALRGLEARGALLHDAAPFLRLLLGEGTNAGCPPGAGHE
jgi:hypothetical protein